MEYHSHVLTECVPEDANELEAAAEASEEEKARPYYTRENPDDTRDLHMHNISQTPARRRPIDLIQVAVRFNDPLIPNRLSDEKPALFDTGANASFISLRLVQLWGLQILVEGLPWVPDRPTLGSRFFSGLCQVPAHKTVSGGFPRVFRFPQLLL